MNLREHPFVKLADTISNPFIKEWKQQNKKILGYYCTYIPEEIIDAAGILPYRMRATGSDTEDLADIYMVRFTCGFVRKTLDLALRGGYDFLDGLFVSNSCDHVRRMYEVFDLKIFTEQKYSEIPALFYTALPHVITPEGFEWYKNEIVEFEQELIDVYHLSPISEERLTNSIKKYNENRRLLREIDDLRMLSEPKISGSDFLLLSMANSSVTKDEANRYLSDILASLKDSEGKKEDKKRILLMGSICDSTDFTEVIENAGAHIISDLLCFGVRNILDDVELTGNLIENIAKRTYYRMSCPRMMDDHPRRIEYLKKKVKEADIDGVIMQRINNCDLHGCENMMSEHDFKDLGIPAFNIDREAIQSDFTRLQTRIEAFLEMM